LARNTNERIIEVARKLFFQEGYDGTRLERLAAELGITKRTIYNHFASKEHLLFAVLELDLQSWIGETRAIVRDPNLEMGERFLLMQSRAVDRLQRTADIFPRAISGPKLRLQGRIISDFVGELAELFAEVVILAKRTGYLLPDTDPRLLSHVLVNIGAGLTKHCEIPSVPYDAPTLLTESVRMVLGGVLTELGRRRLDEIDSAPGGRNGEA
jgi:AcrR family transcriptional regulator